MKPQNQAPEGVQTRAMEAAAVNTATAPPQSPSPQRTQPPPQLPSQQRMPQLSTSPQRTQPSRPMPGTPTLRPPAPRAPAPPATSGIPAAGRPPVPPRVTVHLAPYNGLSSVVQWWLNFLSYVQLYQLADDQAINILPFYFTEPVKHWFYQLEANARSSLSQFKLAFFSRFRKNDEDLDLDDIKQGQEEDIDSFLFRLQQAASDLNIAEVELTKKAVKGLRQNIRGHVYMRKPRTMEDLRQEAKLVERGLNMSNPIGDDITATIQASVNAAVSSMQQLMAPVSAMESDPTNRPPNRPPLHQYQQRQQHQQNQQHQQHHQQSSRQERMRGKRVCFNCELLTIAVTYNSLVNFFRMFRCLLLVVLVVGSHGQGNIPNSSSEVDPKLDMYGIINVLYLKADKDMNGMISEPELADVYHGFDTNGDGHVTKSEFVTLWQSITHQNQEHAEAFFYLADLNDDNIIDSSDLNPLYNVFDTDGDGQVTANEFAEKWVGIILEAPIAVLFERSDANKDNILTHNEFSKFFSSFDTNGDHSVTRSEFEHGWTSSGFGTTTEADTLFTALDTDHDGRITASHDLNSRFTALDVNHDHHLIILEAIKMAAYLPKPSLQG